MWQYELDSSGLRLSPVANFVSKKIELLNCMSVHELYECHFSEQLFLSRIWEVRVLILR